MLQTFTAIGVPLFLMLTGYLNLNKIELSKKYYRSIWRVLAAYLFFSVATIVFRKYFLGHEKSVVQWVLQITSFSAIPYGWYIEMWIGLFLFTPFLNRLWHSLKSRRNHQILIVTLFCCASLPDFTNRYGLYLLPAYWASAAYPVLAFYIGAYVRTYRPVCRPMLLMGIITALCLFNPILSLIVANGKPMMHLQGGPAGIISIPIAVCTFLLFYRIDIKNRPIRSLITKISLLSLDMYLVAYLFDQWFYPIWKEMVGTTQIGLASWYLPIILSLVVGTLFAAQAKEVIFDLFTHFARH